MANTFKQFADMTLEDSDDEEFRTGPFSVLHDAVKNNKQIGISLHNNQNLVGHVRAFDRHFNMELENVKEMKDSRGIQVPTKNVSYKERFFSKMFIRGDSVVMVFKDPPAAVVKQ